MSEEIKTEAQGKYEKLNFKIPVESPNYNEHSMYIINSINDIIHSSIKNQENKILINTNLKLGLPMENINKIAGPFVEAWAQETFNKVFEDKNNKYSLVNLELGERLNMADIILQFKVENNNSSTANIDVKATSQDIPNSGKSPNITSFVRIRNAYIQDPDFIFIILSIKHKVYNLKDKKTDMMLGVMEIVDFNSYDLKHISSPDISYNPALGTGQIQIKDIHYVSKQNSTSWEFCQMLDKKCIFSKKGYDIWYEYAKNSNWIKDDE